MKRITISILILFVFVFSFSVLLNNEAVSAQRTFEKSSNKPINPIDIIKRFKSSLKHSENAGDPCEPTPIAFGQTINGSLVNGDCTDPDTGQVADVYIFSGTQGQAISSAFSSSQFDTVLLLADLSGEVVTFNDDIDGTTTNSRIPPTGTFTLPSSGQYILFATAFDPTGRGSYTINLLSGTGAGCDYTLNPTNQHFSANGGTGSFSVTTTQPTCDWQATSNVPWITTNSSGTGNGTVNYAVEINTSAQGRGGVITVGNKTFALTQNPLSCSYSILPRQPEHPAIGGQFSFTLEASSSLCPTNVTTTDNWITILNPNGTGTRTLNYMLASNNIPIARNGTFFVGSSQFGILQWWRRADFSFDTGGQSNLSLFRPSTGAWIYRNNNFNTGEPSNIVNSIAFGLSTDKIAPADYDGDGRTDIVVFRDGNWYMIQSRNFNFRAVQFGQANDKPIPGDFDGDGKADISVYRPSAGSWFRLNSTNNQFVAVQFGIEEDVPLMADFNADGRNEIAVYRPSAGAWYWLDSATNAFNAVGFGLATDIPVPADYDGDSKTDIAVYRPSEGYWYRLNSSNNQFVALHFGTTGDIPVPAEYDRDGKADIAVYRPSTGIWYRLKSATNTVDGWQFGTAEDKPIPAAYQP